MLRAGVSSWKVLSPRFVHHARRSIGPKLPVRSIEADEGSTDTRSACDSREAEGVLNEHRRDRNRIGPREVFVNLSRGKRSGSGMGYEKNWRTSPRIPASFSS
jgi:hypothetical protein